MFDINKKILLTVGEKIRQQRDALHYSQRDVADLTGLTVNTISAIENGKGGTLNNFLLICRAIQLQAREAFAADIPLIHEYELPPQSRRRIDITRKLEMLIFESDFFATPKRVSEVLETLEMDRSASNRFSVYLTSYCKEGVLESVQEGTIKKYKKKS